MENETAPDPDPLVLDTEALSPRVARQSAIRTVNGPEPSSATVSDYLSVLTGEIRKEGHQAIKVDIFYVPGRLLLKLPDFAQYLTLLSAEEDEPLQALAHKILDDLNNELVARWVQVRLEQKDADNPVFRERVMAEDQEPRWSNPALMARIPPLT